MMAGSRTIVPAPTLYCPNRPQLSGYFADDFNGFGQLDSLDTFSGRLTRACACECYVITVQTVQLSRYQEQTVGGAGDRDSRASLAR